MNKIFIAIFTALFAYSCSPTYYMPNTHNVPLFIQKDEVVIAAAGNDKQIELQAAYAMKNDIGIQVNTGAFFGENAGDNGTGGFGEIGVGVYKPLQYNLIFETYALAGIGRLRNNFPGTIHTYPGTTGEISSTIMRIGMQPSIGLKYNNFSVSFSTRFAYLGYFGVDGSLIYDDVDQVRYLKDNNAHFIIDPALTLKGGLKNIQLTLQLGSSANIFKPNFRQDSSYMSFGLCYRWLNKTSN